MRNVDYLNTTDTLTLNEGAQANYHSPSLISNSSLNDSSYASAPRRPQTPYQVLRLLPKDATPAQQDSAIQAWFEPGEIHYSSQPDTLHLPGHDVPRDLKKVELPQYYRENFFSADTLYHPELNGGRIGVAGTPVPYAIHNDNVITGILIVSFLLIMFAISRISSFLLHQAKHFFYAPKTEQDITETGTEIKFQLVFLVITSIFYALLFYFYATSTIADTFILSSEYALLGVFCAIIFAYFAIKAMIYTMVNNVFFSRKKNLQFLRTLLFIITLEGICLFPLVLMVAYLQFSIRETAIYCIFIVTFAKILTFYKAYIIFFKQNRLFLQIILYFCALEMVPLVMLWGGLLGITNILKVNY